MKLSYSWLNEYVDHDLSPKALAEALTMSGLEVEGVEERGGSLEGVVVGHVVAKREHPNADRLVLCDVDLGDGDPVQIVCGAPNVAAGQKVPVATVGASLPTPDGGAFTIKKAKMRGEVSMGMICAEDELGLSDDHAGIMVLDDDAEVGRTFADYLAERGLAAHDAVLDVSITPNRPDAVSHLGVARDVAALQDAPLRRPDVAVPDAGGAAAEQIAVDLQAPDACPRYVAMIVRDVKVDESPTWLKQRLTAVGLRPINNVVDVTNYVMYECGQPLHAFDYEQIEGRTIVVRTSAQGERFTTLDGKERTLPEDTLLICDAERPVAVAGVMGGENSEVTDATTHVLIESAYFEPSGIRRTAKALGLQTDSSYRFERGVDRDGQPWAARRAAELIAALGGGTLVDGMVDAHPVPPTPTVVTLRLARIAQVLGTAVPEAEVRRLLAAIGFELAPETDAGDDAGPVLRCVVPPFRPDVEREIDVIEEVARLYGFDRIPAPKHTALPNVTPRPRAADVLQRQVRATLAGLGFREIYTNSMLRRETADRFAAPVLHAPEGSAGVETLNPISQEMAALRPSLLPGALQVMGFNRNHGQDALRFFELGHVAYRTGDRADRTGHAPVLVPGYAEPEALLIVLAGPRAPGAWDAAPQPADFFDLKGVVETLLAVLRIDDVRMTAHDDADDLTAYHLDVWSGDVRLGALARVASALAEAHDLEDAAFFAELNWTALRRLAEPSLTPTYAPVSRYPVVERDLAVVVPQAQAAGPLLRAIREAGQPLLQHVTVFDVYEGKGIPEGRKSVAFALRFGADRTLKDAEVDARIDAVVRTLAADFDAALRG